MHRHVLFIALGLAVAPAISRSAPPESSLTVTAAWTRATPPGTRTGAGYLTIENRGPEDRLLSAESPRAGRVEIHGMSNTGGVMKMWPIKDGLVVPKGGQLSLAPGGTHLMLLELDRPIALGEKLPMVLRFEKAGVVEIELQVMPLGSKGPGSQPASRPGAAIR
jgi:copper(I)-binding protein